VWNKLQAENVNFSFLKAFKHSVQNTDFSMFLNVSQRLLTIVTYITLFSHVICVRACVCHGVRTGNM